MSDDIKTTITCEQLGNFIHETWMDITQAETVQEIEIKLDMIEDQIGDSLAPCVGYDVLNNKRDDWDSVTKILESLKADARASASRLHREGADGAETYTSAQFDRLIKHIDQIGKDTKKRMPKKKNRFKSRKMTPTEFTSQYEQTSTTQYD